MHPITWGTILFVFQTLRVLFGGVGGGGGGGDPCTA
jgi:hypothetical protein